MSSTPSNNPLRKWEKKLRNAKTEEQKEKAESMLRALRPKVRVVKESKPVLTEDQLIQEAIEENMDSRDREEKKRVQEKKKSLERDRRRVRMRAEILSGMRKSKAEKVAKVEEKKEQYEKYKGEESEHNQRVLSHRKHSEKFAEQAGVKGKMIDKHKNNKRQVEKEYKKFINKTCENIELTIQFVKAKNEMSYEEALTLVYSHTIKEEIPSNQEDSTQLSLTDKVEEPVQEDPVQEDPVQEDPVQEEPVVEELTEEDWQKIVEEHPELKL